MRLGADAWRLVEMSVFRARQVVCFGCELASAEVDGCDKGPRPSGPCAEGRGSDEKLMLDGSDSEVVVEDVRGREGLKR
jgi:hypothetical protein